MYKIDAIQIIIKYSYAFVLSYDKQAGCVVNS